MGLLGHTRYGPGAKTPGDSDSRIGAATQRNNAVAGRTSRCTGLRSARPKMSLLGATTNLG
jgi:hypothetical protein